MGDEHLISLQPGTVIAGRYEVVKCLGAGNMGLVYACRHRELAGHMVAIKVLFPEVAQDKIAAQRFRNEIFAAYGVSHQNVVRAYEYLRDGDLVAYTMEYVGGGDLADRLARQEEIPIPEVMSILSQICSGVQAIHDAGIVHRDLKPENILLTKDGVVKIADFGIARVGHSSKLTEHGGVVGTIDYVAPEYMLNSQVDWRSDIYAIGILGYEMITGNSPFRGDSVYATMTKRLKCDPAPPSTLRPECSPELGVIILKALERDPAKRFQSAAEMFYELRKLQPEQANVSIGAILQISQSPSSAYVGPSWAEEHAADPVEQTLDEDRSAGVNDTLDYPVEEPRYAAQQTPPPAAVPAAFSAAGGAPALDATMAYQGFGAHGTVVASSAISAALAGAAVKRPEVVEISSQYHADETVYRPSKMDSVLGYDGAAAGGSWNGTAESARGGQVITNKVGIDDSRIRRLSQFVEKVEPSIWLEIVTLIVAIVIGVGVGFVFVRYFFPDLMAREPVAASHQ